MKLLVMGGLSTGFLVMGIAWLYAAAGTTEFTRILLEQAGRLALHIEGAEKQKVLKQALAEGPEEDMPVRAVLRGAAPVTLYWCP